jgi:ABC-type nitrate/sulfonate/bicarbonate transport system permease component
MTKEEKQLLEMAKVFHMPKFRIFMYIILPSIFKKKQA